MLISYPNIQTNLLWASFNPRDVVKRKKASGQTVMGWVNVVDGRCLSAVYCEGSGNGNIRLAVKDVATRIQYWFQQDGASCPVSAPCLQFKIG